MTPACEALAAEVAAALDAGGPCLTPALLGARDRAIALSEPACADATLARAGFGRPRTLARWRGAPPPDKTVREAIAPALSVFESDDFAIKYGPTWPGDEASLQAIADAFEVAWDAEVSGLGYPAPPGTDAYKFNVYIGDTGNGAPGAGGAAGYYYVDAEGYGYVVLSIETALDPSWLRETAAHEFFHAIQDGAATYTYEGQGAWYWEAGAMWVQGQVLPDSDGYATFLAGFALLPERPVNDFRYPDGTLAGYHQYGAFLYLQHLTEVVTGDPDVVRRSWVEAPRGGDPLRVLDDLLDEGGHAPGHEVFHDFAARAATFDWTDEAAYEASLDAWGGFGHPEATRPSGTVFGADQRVEPPDPPATYGANYWAVIAAPDAIDVAFEGDRDADWRVVVAWQDGDTHTRAAVALDEGRGEGRVAGLTGADDVWVVVSATDGTFAAQTYDYTLTLSPVEPPDPGDTDGEERRACGCAGTSARGSIAALVAAVLARRRRGISRPCTR